ncbi:phage N-6-adenine-methyltransferase [Pantoea agglomerans]|uniref:phage N-6-adenine-methyltransferase n=1 Tax=Enterobacter agglomerans TaxID=549 RepID=UPI002413AEDD|nr:phage N-6-adenine-methyltransferase [Pantoea agglomerans]
MSLSAYSQSLVTLRNQESHELKEVGDQWCTPDLLFWGINALFGPLMLDLFADDLNAKCPVWYTAEDNALSHDWSEKLALIGGAAFGNPPYSRSQYDGKQAVTGMTHIMSHAAAMRDKGGRYVFLIKAAPSEKWWPEDADHIVFIRGRIGFDLPQWFVPADDKQKPTSAFFAGAIAVFDKSWRGERFSYVSRTELEAKGRVFMSLAQFAFSKHQPPVVSEVACEPATDQAESELPLSQKEIFRKSGVRVWACVRAAFGDKEEYTFSESKFGHTWAADSVEAPEFAQVSPVTIDNARQLIRESILFGVDEWLLSLQFDDDAARADASDRIRTVAVEASAEYGINSHDFIAALSDLDVSKWSNIRQIRAHIREKAKPAAESLPESRIWPLEVGLVFSQIEGADSLAPAQQNKLKANINQLWLERMPTSEIISVAGGLVNSMQGAVNA